MNIFLIIISILILWSAWGYFSSKVEQAEYSVVQKMNGYEIRHYPAHIVAQTKVEGSYDEALNKGFSIVAGYIFGGNTRREKIAMTAPVKAQKQSSEKISMIAPVLARTDGSGRIVSFGMPKAYSLASLPVPNDARVELVQIPEKKMAALRFSWFRTTNRVRDLEEKLLKLLANDKTEVVGAPSYAGYNAPWVPPWMARHEMLVEVK